MGPNYHLALRRSCPGCGQFASMVAAHQEYVHGPDKAPCECAAIKAERLADERLGWIARLVNQGQGILAVLRRDETRAAPERFPEVTRLLLLTVHYAAASMPADAIEAARSALASCPGVPELAADVARIIAILEAT